MSSEYSTAALKVRGIKPDAKFALFLLANYADSDGFTTAAPQHVAETLGCTIAQARALLRALEDRGLIRHAIAHGAAGYQLDIHAPAPRRRYA